MPNAAVLSPAADHLPTMRRRSPLSLGDAQGRRLGPSASASASVSAAAAPPTAARDAFDVQRSFAHTRNLWAPLAPRPLPLRDALGMWTLGERALALYATLPPRASLRTPEAHALLTHNSATLQKIVQPYLLALVHQSAGLQDPQTDAAKQLSPRKARRYAISVLTRTGTLRADLLHRKFTPAVR